MDLNLHDLGLLILGALSGVFATLLGKTGLKKKAHDLGDKIADKIPGDKIERELADTVRALADGLEKK